MKQSAVHKITDAKKIARVRAWRDEKVFIYFSPRGTILLRSLCNFSMRMSSCSRVIRRDGQHMLVRQFG